MPGDASEQRAAKRLLGDFGPGDRDDDERAGQESVPRQVDKRGHQLASGEVARGAEDHDGAGIVLAGGRRAGRRIVQG